MRLSKLRKEIDIIDDEIISLLKRRIDIAENIAGLKKAERLQIRDRKRESEIYSRLEGKAEKLGFDKNWLLKIFRLIIKTSVRIQKLKK